MPVKLNSAGGGSVTMEVGSTASNFTVTMPSATGTAVIQNASNNLLMNSGYGSDAVAYGCRAWVNFNGTGTVAIRASGNVSSITDNGTGDYTVNFTTALADANYSVVGVCQRDQVTGNAGNGFESVVVIPKGLTAPLATGSARIRTIALDRTYDDATIVNLAIFR